MIEPPHTDTSYTAEKHIAYMLVRLKPNPFRGAARDLQLPADKCIWDATVIDIFRRLPDVDEINVYFGDAPFIQTCFHRRFMRFD